MEQISFSAVIPVCHGGRFLEAALHSAVALDYPSDRVELLVAAGQDDQASRQAVAEAAAQAPFPVRFVPCSSSNRSSRLNRACSQARGAVLAFTDDDCVLPRDWLRAMDAVLGERPELGALGGDDVVLAAGPFDLALDWVLHAFVGTGGCRSGRGPRVGRYYPKLWNMAVPRGVAEAVALPSDDGTARVFDESLAVHEDVELMRRIEESGRRLVYEPSVRVSHCRDTTSLGFTRRSFNMARVCRREGLHRLPHVLLVGVGLVVLGLGLAAIRLPAPRLLLAIGGGLYAVVLAASAIAGAAAKRSLAVAWHIPILLAGSHLARAVGYLFPAASRDSTTSPRLQLRAEPNE